MNVCAKNRACVGSLTKEILQILPADVVGQLKSILAKNPVSVTSNVWGTNVGNIDLPATSSRTTAWGSTKATLESAATHAAIETSARGTGIGETRLGLSVFANVYESTH